MQRKETITLSLIAIMTALVSLFIANTLFDSPSKHTATAPTVQAINSTFPDVKNDPDYKFFLPPNALDPTQPIQIGGSQNSTPFNGTSQ